MSVEQAHMKDVLCYLRILQNPYDELAWLRVLKMLPRVGSALSQKIWQHISRVNEPLKLACESDTANLLPANARPFYLDLMNLIGTLTQLNTPAEIIDMTLEQFYGDYLVSHYDGADLRKEDLKALANFAAQETITPPCVIPEPTTICPLGLGVLGLLRKRRA